jgi:hypothetical protein
LYQSERWHAGPFGYRFLVPNGTYTVTLKFAEIFFRQAGDRVFHLVVNGVPVAMSFDVVREAGGPGRAVDRSFVVPVSQGQIVIQFVPVVSNPKVNAIEIGR